MPIKTKTESPYEIIEINGSYVVPTCLIKDKRTGEFVRNPEGKNIQFPGPTIEVAREKATSWCNLQEENLQ